jgi:hypothetical protein
MRFSLLLLAFFLSNPGQPPPSPTFQAAPLSKKFDVLEAVVAITTRPPAELSKVPADQPIEHDSEVSRSELITVVVEIHDCQADAKGSCNARADVTVLKPDGKVHSEMKDVSLASRRGTATLKLSPSDPTGVYTVVATVRDLTARRFAKTERKFGVT